jgi:hypothetical protein
MDAVIVRELLMPYLQRSIRTEALPGKETVNRFNFSDLKRMNDWWLLVSGDTVDVCVKDPGREVDIHFATDLRTMIQVWMGDISFRTAVADGRKKIVGPSALTRDVKSWLAPHPLSGIRPAGEIA